jgi:hypothetical protein
MARAVLLLWCTTIVAVFQPRPIVAAPLLTRVRVTPAVAALAERLGMDAVRDRTRFVPEIVRRIYSPPPNRQPRIDLLTASRAAADAGAPQVDVPLTPELWRQAIFPRTRFADDDLLAAILSDRHAALLARGLWAADDETLEFFAGHPSLLTFIYEHAAPAYAAFASSVRVHGGRVVVPGGTEAEPLWESVIHARVSDPQAFVLALFGEPEWRTAYLVDVVAAARPDARRFALGFWMDDAVLRARRFAALSAAVHARYREWHVDELPFARPLNDLAMLLLRVRVDASGTPLPPAQRAFWTAALNVPAGLASAGASGAAPPLVDAAWLVDVIAGDMYTRGNRLDQFSFGQRVFERTAGEQLDLAAAVVRDMPTHRMLLLTLERLGIVAPSTYAAAIGQARAALDSGAGRFWTNAGLQGALAIVVRMTTAGTLPREQVERLVESLFAAPLHEGEYRGALAEWFTASLGPHLPDEATWEARLIAALAGRQSSGGPHVDWEGQSYRLDLAYAERRRITEIRVRQGGPDLDTALTLARLGRDLARARSVDAARPLADEARGLLDEAGARLARPPATSMAPGVPLPRDGREWLARAADDLARAVASADLRRAARAGESLVALSDITLGHAVLSIVYAVHLGDPEGPALLGTNVALRHDFGFGRLDITGGSRGPWAQPRQDFQPGVPWHVTGSLVGLDIALAPLTLHRLSMDGLATPPRLASIEREAFAVNVALLDPRQLNDGTRDALLARMARGRARIDHLTSGSANEIDRLVDELQLDGWRERTLRLVLQNDPASVDNQFSLAETVVLGGEAPPPDAWGANGLLPYGCICTRFPSPGTWRVLAGRTQLAMMAAAHVDMNLELARRLATLRLPAALLPSVLATAMQDFVDRSGPADPNDFAGLIEYPRRLDADVVADYVAAAATLDGPLVSSEDVDPSEP